MNKVRNWIIGTYLAQTDSVFEKARIRLLFNFVFFYLLSLLPFYANVLANNYYLHAGILAIHIVVLVVILVMLKTMRSIDLAAKILFYDQIFVGTVSFLIQRSAMDHVGEFFIVVNIMLTFFTLGRNYGFVMSAIWSLQILHCLANELSHGKFILFNTPEDQILPPAPVFIFIPMLLGIYVIYEFVKTRSEAEKALLEQKQVIEHKNKEITDSINYAKRIQYAHLPRESYIKKILGR